MRAAALYALAIFLALPMAARADTTGSLNAATYDESGKPIAGVRVVASSSAQEVSGETNARGEFTFVDLIPGTYTVELTKRGFADRSYRSVVVVAGNERHLRLALATLRIAHVDGHFYPWWICCSPAQTADIYVVTHPFFDSFQRIDLSTIPAAPAGGGSVKF